MENHEQKKGGINLGLVPRIIIAIAVGILIGQLDFVPEWFIQLLVTISGIFSSFLGFIIPLMIVGLVVKGISDLTEGAGKLLGITVGISYGSTLIAGSLAYLMAITFFPSFITSDTVSNVAGAGEGVSPFFSIPLAPMLDVTAAIIFAFLMGLGISWLKQYQPEEGQVVYNVFSGFEKIIMKVLELIIVPFLPFYILGNFANLSYSGAVFSILSVFWKVFILVIALHLIYISVMFVVAGTFGGKNPFRLIKNQIPCYMTALGTQSSAATIP
ncbi:MAG: cation:dicarboxylase symporter family transporter, partial [Gallicola sp.]|nr:cation:dicarboxylase symporter family transporter [Gallicola sp.]